MATGSRIPVSCTATSLLGDNPCWNGLAIRVVVDGLESRGTEARVTLDHNAFLTRRDGLQGGIFTIDRSNQLMAHQ
ncbi:MAG TPA: hypothetical protein VF458_08185 [Ktedonobacteraceae bacterium]